MNAQIKGLIFRLVVLASFADGITFAQATTATRKYESREMTFEYPNTWRIECELDRTSCSLYSGSTPRMQLNTKTVADTAHLDDVHNAFKSEVDYRDGWREFTTGHHNYPGGVTLTTEYHVLLADASKDQPRLFLTTFLWHGRAVAAWYGSPGRNLPLTEEETVLTSLMVGDFQLLSTGRKLIGNWFEQTVGLTFNADGSVIQGSSMPYGDGIQRKGLYAVAGRALAIRWTDGLLPRTLELCGFNVSGSVLNLSCPATGNSSWIRDECITCETNGLSAVSGATFADGLASGSIVTAFGHNLASTQVTATGNSLPMDLGGVTLYLTDSNGVTRLAALFLVSTDQINLLIPEGVALGMASLSARQNNREVARGVIWMSQTAPGMFTVTASGAGLAAAQSLTIRTGSTPTLANVFTCGAGVNSCKAVPLDVSGDRQVFLVLYGTGIRHHSGPVTATVGGLTVPVTAAVALAQFAGLDQVNVGPLPASLVGRGDVPVVIATDGAASNAVTVSIK